MTPETESQRTTRPGLTDPPPARRGRPPRLSRAAILDKAIELIDAEGADALTMRRLGSELGVEAMSLYRHVASKRALLDGIAERLMAEVNPCLDERAGGWADSARCLLLGIRAVALAHPAAFELVGLRALNTHDALRPIEAFLTDLRDGGFPPDRTVAIYRLLTSYLRGFALTEIVGFSLVSVDDPAQLRGAELPPAEFPTIRSLADEISDAPTDAHFRAGLETILAGLQLELDAATR